MKRIILFVVLGLLMMLCGRGGMLYAQDAAADLKRVSAFYREHVSYSQQMEIKTYKQYTDKTPFDVQSGELIKKGDLLYTRQGGVEQIRNREYMLSVNNTKKTIVMLQRKVSGTFDFSKVNYDSLLRFCQSVVYHPMGEDKASYALSFRGEEYSMITLVFDKKSFRITGVEYILAERSFQNEDGTYAAYKSKMKITYSDFKPGVSYPDDYFSYKRFLVRQSGNRYVCTPAYRGYSFVNQNQLPH
jgi:outer membrane lipoprotein-sorting protein